MKKIGLISDRKSKKSFLLPQQIKEITGKNVEVYVQSGYGKNLSIKDEDYLTAGAKVVKNSNEVIAKADIILKVNAFSKSELAKCQKKICITMVNYLVNADMILTMLKNNVTSIAWNCLSNKSDYIFFEEFEKIKGRHCVNQMIYAWANKGLGLSNATVDAKHPQVLILNASYAALEAARACLANNIDVTLADYDLKYLDDLKQDTEIKKLESIFGTKLSTVDAKFETLMRLFKTHDGFIYTCADPMSKTSVRITAEMAKEMPAGSFMIDAACENGYGFNFQKDFVKDTTNFKQFENTIYSCVENITDLYPKTTSKILSKKSAPYILALAEKGTDALKDIVITKDGKVVSEFVKNQLHLI